VCRTGAFTRKFAFAIFESQISLYENRHDRGIDESLEIRRQR